MLKQTITIFALAGALAAQAPTPTKVPAAVPKAAPAPAKPAAAAASRVDTVIELVKGGMSEALVIKTLQKENKPIDLTTADMLKLQKAGVSEKIMEVMGDPSTATKAPVAAASVSPSPVAPTPAPKADNPPAVTGQATPFPAAQASTPSGPRKRRLAVEAFDYSAVKTAVTYWFHNDVNIGQGIRAMLTTRMAQAKNITLLEREKLNNILKEQDLGSTNRVNQGTKAKIGKVTGADAILFGDITIFGRDDTTKRNGVAGVIGGKFGGIGLTSKEEKAVVAITLRIVDAESGEVVETGEARGESERKSRDWGALTAGWSKGAAVGSDMTSSNFEQTIIGEATSDAVNKVVAWLNEKIPQISEKARVIEGRVATIEGNQMYISVGANSGVQVGDRFEIHQINNVVIDPETKQELDKVTVKVGEFVVHIIRDTVAIGEYGGQPVSMSYAKGYAARLMGQ